MEQLEFNELFQIDRDEDLLSYIKAQWDLPPSEVITVVSELQFIEKREILNFRGDPLTFYILKKYFHPVTGRELKYPIAGSKLLAQDEAIYIPKKLIQHDSELWENISSAVNLKLHLVLGLAPSKERSKAKQNPNPIKLEVTRIKVFDEELPEDALYRDPSGKIFVKSSLLKYLAQKEAGAIKERSEKIEHELRRNLEELNNDRKKETEALEALRNTILEERDVLKELEDALDERRNRLNELKDEIRNMSKTHDDLLATVKNNAARFQDLGLLSEDDLKILFPENEPDKPDEESLSYAIDLGGDPARLVRHVQAYLLEQGIRYPRHVLTDFFALLQTGDLIILAGDSGSGKTQLVRSFAAAIGGEAAIIPVKPNWTGSEDLFGYYNPLEKRFLPSAFTEALLEALRRPDRPYFICLDEMNLAHVEYYFADFLSKLEDRDPQNAPVICLYPEDEADSNWVELTGALKLIDEIRQRHGADKKSFLEIMQDENLNRELRTVFGLSEKESLMGYYIHLRNIVRNSFMNTPCKYRYPNNVRVIGAINIDETTNFLSPKILDRAHIMKFENPLNYSGALLADEIKDLADISRPGVRVKLAASDLGERREYPAYEEQDDFCEKILPLVKDYLWPLGVDFGFRAMRQGLHYRNIMLKYGENGAQTVLNNFILHKVLPKLFFDGNRKTQDGKEKLELLEEMASAVRKLLGPSAEGIPGVNPSAADSLDDMIRKAKNNDQRVSFWS